MSNVLFAKVEAQTHENERFLLARARGRIVPIRLATITTIEVVGNFAVVYTAGGSFILHETLDTLVKLLPDNTFAHLNHSLILNIRQIEEFQVLGAGGNHFQMKDGRSVALTLQLSEIEILLSRTTS